MICFFLIGLSATRCQYATNDLRNSYYKDNQLHISWSAVKSYIISYQTGKENILQEYILALVKLFLINLKIKRFKYIFSVKQTLSNNQIYDFNIFYNLNEIKFVRREHLTTISKKWIPD